MKRFTRRQVFIFVFLALQNFCNALCFAIQAPFYPSVAESKGVSSTEYGLVFGVYQLTIFFICPVYGHFITIIQPKRLLVISIFIAGSSCVLFGQLVKIEATKIFLILSFLIRIFEAIGSGGCLTASFSIIAKEFPESVGSTMAILETIVGVGLLIGPTIGGVLYEVGGFMLPFNVFGCILIICAVLTLSFLPKIDSPENTKSDTNSLTILKIPEMQISLFTTLAAANNIGYLQATLEPHIRFLNLKPYLVGLMFVIGGSSFAITAPIWGKLCDKGIHSILLHVFASLIVIFGWILIGPAPNIPLETSLPLIVVGLILNGVGVAGELIPSFSGSNKFVVAAGLPRNLATLGLVSGIWNSIHALGAFIGPSVGGALIDYKGFKTASIYILTLHSLICVLSIIYICFMKTCHNFASEFSLLNHTDESFLAINSQIGSVSNESIVLPKNDTNYKSCN